MIRRIIKADDSCLFNAVGLAMEDSLDKAHELRKVIAQDVMKDTATFNEGMLEKSPKTYVDWIMKPTSWGGAIEMLILSQHYKCEITAVDV